jgi:hypothetical protein
MANAPQWRPYPLSGQAGSPIRMSSADYDRFRGILGHMHVPGNTHGDPGALNVARILATAKQLVTPPTPVPAPPKETDVPLTDADVQKILDTPLAPGALTVRGALSKAAWLADQFGQSGQFEDQLDRIEVKP